MKKGVLAVIIFLVSATVSGLIAAKRDKAKELKKEQDLREEFERGKEQLRAAQEKLNSTLEAEEATIQETMKLIDELRSRLDQPDCGVDPRSIDLYFEEVGA